MEKKVINELKLSLLEEFKKVAKDSTRNELEKYVQENSDKINLYKLTEVLTSVQLKDVTFLNNDAVDQFGIMGFNANNSSMPNFAEPTAAQEPVTLNYYNTNLAPLTLGTVTTQGTLAIDANGETIPNLADPVSPQDPVTLNYFDNNHNTQDLTPFTLGVVEASGTTGIDANGETIPNLSDPVALQDPVTLNYFINNIPGGGGGFNEISDSFNSDVGTGVRIISTITNNGNPFQLAVDVNASNEILFKINNTSGITLYTSFVVQRKIPGQTLNFTDPSGQPNNYLSISASGSTFLSPSGTEDGSGFPIDTDSDRNKFLFLEGSIGTLTDNVFTTFNVTLQVAPRGSSSPFNTVLVSGFYTPFGYSV